MLCCVLRVLCVLQEEVAENVKEARDWIRRWRAKQLEKQLPAAEKPAGV